MSNNPNPRPWQAQQAAQRLCVALGLSRDLHTDMLVRIISDSYSRIMDQLRSMQEERQLLRSILECETDDIENPLSPIEAAKKLVTERDTLCAQRNWVQDELERIEDALDNAPSTGCLCEIVTSREKMRLTQAKECEALRDELVAIDGVLARRDALDSEPTRCDKILKCISVAKQVDTLIGERDRLCEQIVEIRKVADAHSSLAKAVASERLAHTRSDQESYIIIKDLRAKLDKALADNEQRDERNIDGDLKRALEAEKEVSEARRIIAENWEHQLDESSKECVRTHLRNVALVEETNQLRAEIAKVRGRVAELQNRMYCSGCGCDVIVTSDDGTERRCGECDRRWPTSPAIAQAETHPVIEIARSSPSLDPPEILSGSGPLIDRCEHCNSDQVIDYPYGGCPGCGAPVCCESCCKLLAAKSDSHADNATEIERLVDIFLESGPVTDSIRAVRNAVLAGVKPCSHVSEPLTEGEWRLVLCYIVDETNPKLHEYLRDIVARRIRPEFRAGAKREPLSDIADAAYQQSGRDTEYYRGLVLKVLEPFGPEKYQSDDGSIQDTPLCAKAPELVARAMEELKQLRVNVGPCDHTTESLSREEFDQALDQWLALHPGADRHSTNSAYAAARICCARRILRAGGTI